MSKERRLQPVLTVALPALLEDGQNGQFRDFVADLFAVSAAMQLLRREIARAAGLGSTELAVMLAIARLAPEGPIGIRRVADHLNLAGPNITAGVNALVRRGFLKKEVSVTDGRAVILLPTEAGVAVLALLAPLLRQVNAELFGMLTQEGLNDLRGFFSELLARMPAALGAVEAPTVPGAPVARLPAGRGSRRRPKRSKT